MSLYHLLSIFYYSCFTYFFIFFLEYLVDVLCTQPLEIITHVQVQCPRTFGHSEMTTTDALAQAFFSPTLSNQLSDIRCMGLSGNPFMGPGAHTYM